MEAQIRSNDFLISGRESGSYGYPGLSPEQALEQRAIARKQQIMSLLMSRGMQGAQQGGQMVGRFYVPSSPLQNAAGLAEMAVGAFGGQALDRQGADLQRNQGEARATAIQEYIDKTSPKETYAPAEGPGAPVDRPDAEREAFMQAAGPDAGASAMARGAPGLVQEGPRPTTPVPTMQPPNPAIARVAQAQLATSQDPYLRQYAMAEAQRQGQTAERDSQREFLTAQGVENRQNRLDVSQQGAGRDIILATMMGASKEQLEKMREANALLQEELRGKNAAKVATIGADAKIEVAGMKDPKAVKAEATQKGQENVQLLSAQLRDYYGQLNESGGITSTAKNPAANAMAALGTSGVGQTGGSVFGTKNQSIRDSISQQRPLLMQAIMKANNMSAKSMDSNVELKLWLATATDPKYGYEANIRALDMLEKLYGGGQGESDTLPAGESGMTTTVPAFPDPEKQKRYEEFKKNRTP